MHTRTHTVSGAPPEARHSPEQGRGERRARAAGKAEQISVTGEARLERRPQEEEEEVIVVPQGQPRLQQIIHDAMASRTSYIVQGDPSAGGKGYVDINSVSG